MMMNRRDFLIASTLAAAEWTAFQTAGAKPVAPGSKLCHACIGVGNMGYGDFESLKSHKGTQIVALCDVDTAALAKAAKEIPGVRTYTDWRELFAKEGDRIDSVNVTVPDHNHAIITAAAMRLGKHVYCQKPLCHEIAECQLLLKIAKEKGVTTQLGTQRVAYLGERMAVEYLRSGALGKIRRMYLFSTRNGVSRKDFNPNPPPAKMPATLSSWETWIGPAPMRPYANGYHPCLWRVWQDFGSGWIGDMACHIMDAPWRGLGLKPPVRVRSLVQEKWLQEPERCRQLWPKGTHTQWIFEGNALTEGKELAADWYDGLSLDPQTSPDLLPPPELTALAQKCGFKQLPLEGLIVEGTEAWLLLPLDGAPHVMMKRPGAALPNKPKFGKRASHWHEFLDSCIAGKQAYSGFERVVPMVESVLLGNIAERVPGETLAWDSAAMRFTNSPAANGYLYRPYRKGWELAGLQK